MEFEFARISRDKQTEKLEYIEAKVRLRTRYKASLSNSILKLLSAANRVLNGHFGKLFTADCTLWIIPSVNPIHRTKEQHNF